MNAAKTNKPYIKKDNKKYKPSRKFNDNNSEKRDYQNSERNSTKRESNRFNSVKSAPIKMEDLESTIEKIVNESINKDSFTFYISSDTRKMERGSLVISISITNIKTSKVKRIIIPIVNDIKSGLVSISVIDVDPKSPTNLFNCIDKYPKEKIEKYLPTILSSMQNILLK